MPSRFGIRSRRAPSGAGRPACSALVVGLAFLALARPGAARAATAERLPARLDVRADAIGFFPYANATLMTAEGHVRVRAGRRLVTADSVRLDLAANRLVATGNVTVAGVNDTLYVRAYALDLARGTAELIRFDPIPRTFAVADDVLATAREGPAPADTFGATDLTGQRPYIRSKHAVVQTNSSVRMTPAEFPTAAGRSALLPTFVYTYAYNQNFAQQALPSTTLDYPYTLFGTPNSLSALHARYGQYDGIELGFDEHLVDGNREYLAASVLPFRGRRIDLLGFQQIGRGLSHQFSGSFAKNVLYGSYSVQQIGREFSLRATTFAFNATNSEDLTLSTLQHTIPHLFGYQASLGYGYDHNAGQSPFAGDFRKDLNVSLNSPSARLPHGVSASANYTYGLTKYDIPRLFTRSVVTLSLSSPQVVLARNGSRRLSFYGQTQFENDQSRFRSDARRFLFLPDPGQPYLAPDGTPYPGFFAYDGLSTLRTYSLQSTFQGPNDFTFQLTVSHYHDFPQFHGYGRPPLTASATMTARLTSTLKATISRGYTFGILGQRYSQYTFALSP